MKEDNLDTQLLKKHLGFSDSHKLKLSVIEGGFTSGFKFKVEVDGQLFFIKVTDLSHSALDRIASIREIQNYKIIKQLNLKMFSDMRVYFQVGSRLYLVLNFDDAEFGAVNSQARLIKYLDTLRDISQVELSDETRFKLSAFGSYHDFKIKQAKLSNCLSDPYITGGKLYDFNGNEIGPWLNKSTLDELIESYSKEETRKALCFTDANFNNVGFLASGDIKLVDPAFLAFGDYLLDLASVLNDYFLDREVDLDLINMVNVSYFNNQLKQKLVYILQGTAFDSGQGDNPWNKFMLKRARSALWIINVLN